MKIISIKNCDFCFGVKRSIDIALKAANNTSVPVYTIGPLIHNPQVIDDLKKKGIIPVDKIDMTEGKIIIRSHGVAPQIINKIKNLEVIDATCPFVKEAQNYAELLYKEKYKVIIIGKEEHPEVQSILGHTNYSAIVINSVYDAEKLHNYRKVGVVSQTTMIKEEFFNIVEKLLPKMKELRIFNTICKELVNRQEETRKIAKKSDVVFVIGGRNSANTNRLAEIARNEGCETYHIETEEEINENMVIGKNIIGISVGASTPKWIVENVINKIKFLCN